MKQSRISKGLLLALPLVTIGLIWGHGIGSARRARAQPETSAKSAAPPQQLSPEGQASLRAIVQAGNLADLRWPDFSDYRQARAEILRIVRVFPPVGERNAAHLGGAASRLRFCCKRIKKDCPLRITTGRVGATASQSLNPPRPQPSEADAVRFDAALTVCVMRYISDLHIGKVNPKHFDFGLDVEAKKYDLPEFLKEHVVDASDVAAVLAQVEPPYPGYRRTIQALQTYLELSKKDDGEQLPAVQKDDCTRRFLSRRPAADPIAPAGGRPSGRRECPGRWNGVSRSVSGRGQEFSAPAWPGPGWTNQLANVGRSERASHRAGPADATHSRALAMVAPLLSKVARRREYPGVSPARL